LSAPPLASQLILDLPREDVLHVLSVFQEEARRLSELIQLKASEGDVVAFRRAAHALAGAAGAVGAITLERAARAAMKLDGLTADTMVAAAAEIVGFATAARGEAAAVVVRLDKVPGGT